jgi:hypothetical protein
MSSSGKPKTTMAKLKREAALRERRVEKAARKLIRKQTPQLDSQEPGEFDSQEPGEFELDAADSYADAPAPPVAS